MVHEISIFKCENRMTIKIQFYTEIGQFPNEISHFWCMCRYQYQ
jgi:hypothetical protein